MFDPHRTIKSARPGSREIVELRHRLKRQRRIDTARRVRERSRPVLSETRQLDRDLDELLDDRAA